ncbi:hypothetical protein ADIWIN_3678 [Winogradskyella psychrotolerans RS-3]|uniref:Peptidase S74 domain-containing protein n=1 Tax=Winogradskyella psychrotolerans RS-3 TaxID=641526 RepID=S7VLK7_9FLAO|nr:tail fiber domain-containing protein [Winogradskyella psychrotolerans]EPR70322.1 hypothetical protein ADIWIN_3678 [Winogradskyella psychrotolerans RS-3]
MKSLTFLLFFCALNSFAQVGINTETPDASSALDITSSDKGVLIPRISLLSTADTTTIASPLISLLIYNTATALDVTPGYYYWNGAAWSKLATAKTVDNTWSISGNTGTDASVNFIGTIDEIDVVFKRNNSFAGIIAKTNVALGVNALSITTGRFNTATGVNALSANTTAEKNTANGFNTLNSNSTGINNTAVGYSALKDNTIGGNNTASGVHALLHNTEGEGNTANGVRALIGNITGSNNTAIGNLSLSENTIGSNNTAIGYNALVLDGTLDNQVRIGNVDVTYAGVQVAWTITSDRRWKNTIEDSDLGLDFINQLRPVSYYRNNDESQKLEYGFIAQELKEALKNNSSKINGIITEDTEGMLSVRYNDLLAPMVKAFQEQTEELKQLKLKQEAMEKEIKEIRNLLMNKK